jgi:hypothetical protein
MNPLLNILLENATTFEERREVLGLTEADTFAVNNSMIHNLYTAAVQKKYVDFEDIPNTKGDITKYSGYKSMMDSISVLREISEVSKTPIPQLDIVETAVHNIITNRSNFEKGFALNKEFIILLYNSLVFSCIESVSLLLASYIDFIKRPDKINFTLIKMQSTPSSICIQNLDKFNASIKKGEFAKALTFVIGQNKEGLLGIDDLLIPAVIIGGVVLLVPIIREIIFYFYYSRMKASEYLKQQAALLEINKANVQASSLSADKKNSIIARQNKTIELFNKLSEQIKVNNALTEKKSTTELKDQNAMWKINDVKPSNSNLQLL